MKKLIVFATMLLATLSAHASLNQDDVIKALAGQWTTRNDYGDVKFLIRSNGDAQVISNGSYAQVKLVMNYLSSSWGMDGLPVVNIVVSEGSDEDVRDVHFLVTALQDGDEIKIKKMASFSTFNDGPNDFSDAEGGAVFKKYDAKTKKWIEIK